MPQRRRHRHHRLGHLADGAPHRQDRGPDAARGRSPARSTDAGITRADVDFTCAGSCDYVAGQAFSFVQNIDAIGAWPPKRDSHVEMDGAWAHVRGVAPPAARRHRRRGGDGLGSLVDRRPRARSTRWRWTRTTSRRSAPTPLSFAALQARALHRRGQGHRAPDGRDRGAQPARRQGQPARAGHRRLRRRRAARRGLRARAAAPPRPAADHRRRVRGGDRPRPTRPASSASDPVWITGFAHCSELHYPGMRDLTVVAVDHARGQGRRPRRGAGRGGRAPGRVHPRGAAAGRGARARRRRGGQPVGRPARRQPDHGDRPRPRHRGGPPDPRRRAAAARSRTRRRVRACSRTWSASSKGTLQ